MVNGADGQYYSSGNRGKLKYVILSMDPLFRTGTMQRE